MSGDRRAHDPFAPPPAEAVEDAVELEDMRKADLVALAEQRGIDSSGTKAEIIDRLRAQA